MVVRSTVSRRLHDSLAWSPWQTDEASCNSDADYAPSLYLSSPSFWGARVPEQVLSSEAWSRVVDSRSTDLQRRKHFDYREDWLRDIRGRHYRERITAMVTRWWQLGIVAPQVPDGVSMPVGLSHKAWVEAGRPPSVAGSNAKLELIAAIERLDAPADTEVGLAVTPKYHPPRNRYNRGRCDARADGSEVAIIGAGPAGSNCAWLLRQLGVDVSLWERRSAPAQRFPKSFPPTADSFIHRLGLKSILKGCGDPCPRNSSTMDRYHLRVSFVYWTKLLRRPAGIRCGMLRPCS